MKSSNTDSDTPAADTTDNAMTIGELAERFGLATHVLRHWESVGLLAPERHHTGHRRYGQADLARVAMILIAKDAGLELARIREVFSTGDPKNHADLLREHVRRLEDRIRQAQAAKEMIEHALDCPYTFGECPHARAAIAARIRQAR